MVARVTTWHYPSNKLDEGIKLFKERVVPAAKLRKGYRSGYLLVDRKTGKCISIGFWDSKEDAIADEQSGHFQSRLDIGKGLYKAPPVHELYEVALPD